MPDPGPLPGFDREYHVPIRKDRTANFDPDAANVDSLDLFEKVYVKECIANFLYLPKSDPDFGKFKDNTTERPRQTNAGRTFVKPAIKGSYLYTLQLIPETEITAFGKSKVNPEGGEHNDNKNSISFSARRTITVAEVISWLMNPHLLSDLWTFFAEEDSGAGYDQAGAKENYAKILALTTPNPIAHRLRTVLAPVQKVEASKEPADAPEREGSE